MRRESFREFAKWPSLVSAAIVLGLVVFIRTKDVFESGTAAGMLKLVATIVAMFSLVFALAALPRWPAFVALIVLVYVAYCLLFTSMYQVT